MTQYTNDVELLETSLEQLSQDLADTNTLIGVLNRDISGLEDSVSHLGGQLEALNGKEEEIRNARAQDEISYNVSSHVYVISIVWSKTPKSPKRWLQSSAVSVRLFWMSPIERDCPCCRQNVTPSWTSWDYRWEPITPSRYCWESQHASIFLSWWGSLRS